MKKLMPALERVWYHDSTFKIAKTVRAIMRFCLPIIFLTAIGLGGSE